jgi:hypothetical protein
MDSYETINANPSLDIKNKYGKQSGLISELCNGTGLTRDEAESSRPMHYYVTEFEDFNPDSLTSLNRGINFNNGVDVDPAFISTSSSLRNSLVEQYSADRSMTYPLPTTAGFLRGHGNIKVESELVRPLTEKTKKSCDPLDTHYYDRTMNVFTETTPSPYANIDDFFMPNHIQYGENSRSNQTKKYNRHYTGTPHSDKCNN